MALFQKPIIDKYLAKQDKKLLSAQWILYKNHFHNPDVQENIRNSKEEQYQEGFLRDLFVKILGYTLNPDQNFNLTTELKNVKDSKKADGAIIFDQKVITIIELKGTNTTDLNKIEAQAFGYKNNQPECIYVITSNFEKLRFYIDNAIENIEFNLFRLSEKEFEILYLCLCCENVKNGLPKLLKQESLNQEDAITKKLYQDYSNFKNDLYQNLLKNNPQFSPLELFKKSQKLLDRFLFLFFAEDKLLVQPNSVRIVLKRWKSSKNWGDYLPLYEQYKKYFEFFNKGINNEELDIYPYNGGLFLADDFLDQLKIDDHILYDHTLRMSDYDFNSEVDVNILGHIFENSLNEIDEITQNLQENRTVSSATVSKRKKDGVFYTPKYITKYIVENTVGKLCASKKTELQILDQEFVKDKKRKKDQTQILLDKLKTYRNWLLQITIIDPACGSGAFLNEALNFLIAEHAYIDELQAKLFGDSLILSDVEKSILENNLFGVDINEESVDIAKLSLWLRTARPERKLNNLNGNIKCGNSLIADPQIAGDLAFDWEKEFPQVFEKGGFDVVIGNPPYVMSRSISEKEKEFYYQHYKSAVYQINLYLLFMEKGLQLINKNGKCTYIVPNAWLVNRTLNTFRQFLIENHSVEQIVDLTKIKVFADATVLPVIFTISHGKTEKIIIKEFAKDEYFEKNKLPLADVIRENYLINYQNHIHFNVIFEKIEHQAVSIGDFSEVSFGVKFYQVNKGKPKQTEETVKNKVFSHQSSKGKNPKKVLEGKNVERYQISWDNNWVEYGEWLAEPRYAELFEGDRILLRRIVNERFTATYTNENFCNNSLLHVIKITNDTINPKYILAILNSVLYGAYFVRKFAREEKTFPEIRVSELKILPIKQISLSDQIPFIEKADLMLDLNAKLQEISQKFQRNLLREFSLTKLNTKLENWYKSSFADFLKELEKQKIKLKLAQKTEWEEYFTQAKAHATEISAQISQTDQEIDALVYELYGLNQEEIEIVEKM